MVILSAGICIGEILLLDIGIGSIANFVLVEP